MANVLLIILLILSIILIGLILIQRSEGGALGIGGGGGGGGGGFMSGRGTTDMVQKMTAIIGGIFLAVCLLISVAFNYQQADKGLLDAESAEVELLSDSPSAVDESNKSEITPLNEAPISGNDTTPLGEDSVSEESDPETQEKPQDD